MADKAPDTPQDSSKSSLDLNSLSGLDFGPSWADDKRREERPKKSERSHQDSPRKDRRASGGGSRDRRPKTAFGSGEGGRPGAGGGRPPQNRSSYEGNRPRGDRSRGDRRGGGDDRRRGGRYQPREVFQPTVDVDIYPQDEAFDALVNRLRSSARTYQLFEIAHLILEKPERFVVVVSNKKEAELPPQPLFYSVPGHLPFETEEAAVSYVVMKQIDRFFEVEEVEVEPPSGNFQMVNRCGLTGELLGPPNFHRYQDFLKSHFASRINGMPFDRFLSKVETVKEQEVIDAWLESMKKGHRYKVKDRKDGEPESLATLEAARSFLIQHRKELVVQSADNVRFAGRDIVNLPKGSIRRSVEVYVDQQRHFPLDSANNIRGRLRRHNFTVYKKGSKGVSFVCAVKRKFRDANTVFTDSIQQLIVFIEKNPNIFAAKLSKVYLGIDTEKQKSEALKVTDEEVAKAAEAKAAASSEGAEPEKVEAPKVEATTEVTPKSELSDEEQQKLKQLMIDLRWLITEGYVTEYGDGRLFAPEPLPLPKKKEIRPEKVVETVAAETSPAQAEATVQSETSILPDASAEVSAPVESPVEEAAPEVQAPIPAETEETPVAEVDSQAVVSAPASEEPPEIAPADEIPEPKKDES
ncbi:MAG: hypothetical protein AAF546_11775 [Verrucomicrobiota bacterium]